MAALRTTISNWKIPVQLPPGFLRLLSEEEFRAALANASQVEPPPSKVRPPPPAPSCEMQEVRSLSPDFDNRANAMLAALVAARIPAAATTARS